MDNRTDRCDTSGPLQLLKMLSQCELSKEQLLLCKSLRNLANIGSKSHVTDP